MTTDEFTTTTHETLENGASVEVRQVTADEPGLLAGRGAAGARIVAEADGRIVAAAAYDLDQDSSRPAVEVDPDWRGVGLGSALLARLGEIADAQGLERFQAVLPIGDMASARVAHRAGFPVAVHSAPGAVHVQMPTQRTPEAIDSFTRREEHGAVASLAAVLAPASIVVIGASRDPENPGAVLLENLRAGGYRGPLSVVNPAAAQAGQRIQDIDTYASVGEVPGGAELAVVSVPARYVVDVARECAAAGVRGLVVISAGFAEVDGQGARWQQELLSVCRAAGMRFVGPNCMGVANTDDAVSMHATFSPVPPIPGRTALVSQSGGLGVAAMALAQKLNIGLSVFVSIGNRADVSPNDVLQFLEHDDGTDVALLYVESFGNPRKFARIARRVAANTPVVAVKGGRSAAGAAATASHTGALVAASDATVDALFRQAGVIRADSLEGMLDVGSVLANFPLLHGPRIAIIANAGGFGVLAADACESAGLTTPELSAPLRRRIEQIRPGASSRNPVDVIAGASADEFEQCVHAVAESGEVDAILAISVAPIADGLDDVSERLQGLPGGSISGLPVVPVTIGTEPDFAAGAVFGSAERAVRALGRAWRYRAWRDADHGEIPDLDRIDEIAAAAIVAESLANGGGWLSQDDVERLLTAYGIPFVRTHIAADPAEAARHAQQLGGPVALKASGPTLVHKSDAGAVLLGIDPDQVEARTTELLTRLRGAGHEVTEIVVQQMAPAGVELIVGVVHDATFGPVVACGAGGVLTELIGDVSLRLTPLTDVEAASMVRGLKTFRLLEGYRGSAPSDVAAVEDVLLRLGRLADAHPEIAELDGNPLMCGPDGAIVVDARVRIAAPEQPGH